MKNADHPMDLYFLFNFMMKWVSMCKGYSGRHDILFVNDVVLMNTV
jgi:hypothetical protein